MRLRIEVDECGSKTRDRYTVRESRVSVGPKISFPNNVNPEASLAGHLVTKLTQARAQTRAGRACRS
jgi:hypothetical protein